MVEKRKGICVMCKFLSQNDLNKKETSTHFQFKDLTQSKTRFLLGNETSYPLEPYGCTRHKTRFKN